MVMIWKGLLVFFLICIGRGGRSGGSDEKYDDVERVVCISCKCVSVCGVFVFVI